MKHTYFITGYPGFLASNLIRQLYEDHNARIEHMYLLVLPALKEKAEQELHLLRMQHQLPPIFTIVPGDITKPNLSLDELTYERLKKSVTHVFHLAAIYDLAVPEDIAYQVNVIGTKNVNDWVQSLKRLIRYIYFSTAYVSGTREGKIYEHELDEGQSFRNHYEQTKFEAELLVDQIKTSVPTTIIRPGIVIGHSQTGETIKFDGLYFFLNLFERLSFLPAIPALSGGEAEGNFVPSDYVIRATSYLSIDSIGEGKTYHLTDPNPYKMRELYEILLYAYLGKTPKGKMPLPLIKASLKINPLRRSLRVETEALDYFSIRSSYDAAQATKDLEGSGIACPDFKETVEPIVSYYKKYKHDVTKHITIL